MQRHVPSTPQGKTKKTKKIQKKKKRCSVQCSPRQKQKQKQKKKNGKNNNKKNEVSGCNIFLHLSPQLAISERERETMLSTEMRQRRPIPATEAGSSSDRYTDESRDRRRKDNVGEAEDKGLRWFLPLLVLGCLRHMSATSNIVHDCDEVFNYWEPLHYVLYKSGFQTWEYRFVPFFFFLFTAAPLLS